MLIENGEITYIGNDIREADRTIDATGMAVYPGLINTHHHLYQTFTRNLPQVQRLELFPWLKALYEIWQNLDENVMRYSSLTGMGRTTKDRLYHLPGSSLCFPKISRKQAD